MRVVEQVQPVGQRLHGLGLGELVLHLFVLGVGHGVERPTGNGKTNAFARSVELYYEVEQSRWSLTFIYCTFYHERDVSGDDQLTFSGNVMRILIREKELVKSSFYCEVRTRACKGC